MALTDEERMRKQSEIYVLQADLTSHASEIGDWKVIKCYEASLTGADAPYDIADLHAKRQAVRDKINALQAELAADEA